MGRAAAGALALVLALAWARPARADGAAAQALFDEAVALRDAGNHAEACDKFAESLRLEPLPGTRFNLADCYVRIGKLASAWSDFLHVAAETEKSGEAARAQVARDRARQLEPRLARMSIRAGAAPEGLVVKRNGAVVGKAQWATALPVDPGRYLIEASAPGKESWREEVVVAGEGTLVTVNVPALRDAPLAPMPAPGAIDQPQADEADGGGVSLGATLGLTLGIAGLVGVGLGTAFGVVAIDKKNEVDELCPNLDACTEEGIAVNDEAKTAALVSTVGFIAGGALVAAGVVLWIALPGDAGDDTALRLRLAPALDGGGASLVGAF